MAVRKALGMGFAVLLGLVTLDVAGPSPFGASANAACAPNVPATKCPPAARNLAAGNTSQRQVGGTARNTFSRRPSTAGAPAGTAVSSEKISPRQAKEEAIRQKRQAAEEAARQKKQAAEDAAKQKQQAPKNAAKSNGTTGTQPGTGGPGAKPTTGAPAAKLAPGPGSSSPATAAPSAITCGGGSTLVGRICTCPTGTHSVGGDSLRCVPTCGAGQRPSPDGTSCVAAVLNCTGGMVPIKGACGCPSGTTPGSGAGGQRCLTQCPAGQAQALDGSGKCVAVDANGNQIKGATCGGGATLVNNTCTCPAGTHSLNGGGQLRCVPNCGAAQKPSPDGTFCVAAVLNCTGGMVPINGACGCPAGTTPGPGGQRCFTQCPAGQAQALDGSGKCVALYANGNQIKGVTCLGGATLVNNTCTCPAGTHFAGPNAQQCVPECGTGQRPSPDGKSCVAALNCTGGTVPINGACGCPAGTILGPRGLQCIKQQWPKARQMDARLFS